MEAELDAGESTSDAGYQDVNGGNCQSGGVTTTILPPLFL
jgi:hypothetical protein